MNPLSWMKNHTHQFPRVSGGWESKSNTLCLEGSFFLLACKTFTFDQAHITETQLNAHAFFSLPAVVTRPSVFVHVCMCVGGLSPGVKELQMPTPFERRMLSRWCCRGDFFSFFWCLESLAFCFIFFSCYFC